MYPSFDFVSYFDKSPGQMAKDNMSPSITSGSRQHVHGMTRAGGRTPAGPGPRNKSSIVTISYYCQRNTRLIYDKVRQNRKRAWLLKRHHISFPHPLVLRNLRTLTRSASSNRVQFRPLFCSLAGVAEDVDEAQSSPDLLWASDPALYQVQSLLSYHARTVETLFLRVGPSNLSINLSLRVGHPSLLLAFLIPSSGSNKIICSKEN